MSLSSLSMGRSMSPFAGRTSPGRAARTPRSKTPRSARSDQRKTPRLSKPFVPTPRSTLHDADLEEAVEYPLPTWALQPLHNPEWAGDLRAMFKYYASFGESSTGSSEEGISRSNFWKLVRECRMVDANVNSTNTDIVFQECFPRHQRSNGRKIMNYNQFLLALTILSQRKYGHADPVGGILQLVHEHLLPTAYEVEQSFRSASVSMAPPPFDIETTRLFEEMSSTLRAIFEHYTKEMAGRSRGGQPGITLKQLSKLSEDMGIVPKLLSYSEVSSGGGIVISVE